MGSVGRVFGKLLGNLRRNVATFLTSRSFTVNENAPNGRFDRGGVRVWETRQETIHDMYNI